MKKISLYLTLVILTVNYTTGQTTDWWEPDTIKAYDTSGNITGQSIYTYNDKDYMELLLKQQVWNGSEWKFQDKYSYTYDARGNKLTEFHQEYYSSQWHDTNKRFYTYDNNNNLLTQILQENQLYIFKNSYLYDENNNRLSSLGQSWKNDKWEDKSRDTNEYDENNNLIKSLSESWNVNDNNWKPFLKVIYNSANNKVIERLDQGYRNNEWVNTNRYTYSYHENGKILESVDYKWADSIWTETDKVTYTYDNNGSRLTMIKETWLYWDWAPSYKTIWTYDEDDNVTTELMQYWIGEWSDRLLYSWEYDENSNTISGWYQERSYDPNSTWENKHFGTFYLYYNNMQSGILTNFMGHKIEVSYKKIEKNVGVVSQQAHNISVFPNPTMGQLTINNEQLIIENVEIYDVVGQLLYQINKSTNNQINKEISIDISHLASGMYFLKVDNRVVKIIKN